MIIDQKKLDSLGTQYQLFMEILDDLVLIVDPNSKFIIESVNKSPILEKLAINPHSLIGKSIFKLISSEYEKKVEKVLKQNTLIGNGDEELQLKTSKASPIWCQITIKSFKNENDEERLFLILRDITKTKKLEEELRFNEERFKKITETIPEIRFWKLFNPKRYEEALQSSYEMLELVMENIPQYIYWKDLDLNYLGCNDNYANLIGIEHPENIINKSDKDLLIDEFQISFNHEKEKEVIDTKTSKFRNIEYWTLKSGEKIWVNTNRIPLNDSDGKVVGVLITFDDITERKKAEEDLLRQHDRLERIMETNPAGIISVDNEGNIIYANSQAEKVLQFPKDELIKEKIFTTLFKFVDSKGNPIPKEKLPFQIISKTKKPLFNLHLYLELPNKNLILLSINGTPLIGKDGKIENIIFTVDDVTERELAKQRIKESEEKYRDLLETSSVGIIEINVKNEKVSYLNPKLLELVGYETKKSIYTKLIEDIIHPDDVKKLFRSSEEKELEFRIISKDGKLKWLKGKKSNQYNEKDEIVSFRLWLEDVTEKKMYEELIYELNINFLNFTTNIQTNIQLLLKTCLKLLNGDLAIYVNKYHHEDEQLNWIITTKDDVITMPEEEFKEKLFVNELFNEKHDFPQIFNDIDKLEYAKTDKYVKENNIKHAYGKLIMSGTDLNECLCIMYKEYPNITNQNQLVLFLICDAIEIEQKRWQVQQHLEEQNRTLSEINKLKTDLFSRTSHELKTPLISIKGFTELLLNLHYQKLDKEIVSILEEIQKGSKRLEDYINAIVESSKLEQGLLKLNLAEENLTFLINYCVRQLEGAAELRKQKVIVDVKQDMITLLDKERIYEVLSNLLINAIKYTPVGGQITISSSKNDNFYIVSIKDNGIGLTKEEKEQIFKQFGKIERYGQGWDVGIEGTGLGLYICKEIVELHEGEIWVESEGRNKGSTFSFSIPIRKNKN
ncbi:MAG: PAS domain S-box protein [Promethearchaeota archaeon]|nr:MAG: PAS domain S-box protein [Candidatus Lokiarchaeota archaeon]